ncbi:MAG TPA: transcription factor S [Methanocorpusculum sp.]|nr:transcription factor S [Methanocorpusculum sp.]
MMFCPKCGKLMKSKDGSMVCPNPECGYSEKISTEEKEQMKKIAYMQENDILIVEEGSDIGTKPTIAIKCPNCGHGLAEWWLRQLRSADESEVRFFRCTKCKYTWREYD